MNKQAINKLAQEEVERALTREIKKAAEKLLPKARIHLDEHLNSKKFERAMEKMVKEWADENFADMYLRDYLDNKQAKRFSNKVAKFLLR